MTSKRNRMYLPSDTLKLFRSRGFNHGISTAADPLRTLRTTKLQFTHGKHKDIRAILCMLLADPSRTAWTRFYLIAGNVFSVVLKAARELCMAVRYSYGVYSATSIQRLGSYVVPPFTSSCTGKKNRMTTSPVRPIKLIHRTRGLPGARFSRVGTHTAPSRSIAGSWGIS